MLRWVVWTVIPLTVAVLLYNGAVRIFTPPAQAAPPATAGADVGLDAARAHAASAARAYLTWSPKTLEARQRTLASMFADDIDVADAVRVSGAQRVLSAWAGPALVRDQAARIVVTCLIARGGRTITQNLAVPVAWTLRDGAVDGLVVYDYPSLKPPAGKASAPPDGGLALASEDGDAIASLLTRFFRAYLDGGEVAPEFLTTTAARDRAVRPLGHKYTLAGELSADDVEQIGSGEALRQIAATVRAKDNATGAVFTFRYRVWVQWDATTQRYLVDAI